MRGPREAGGVMCKARGGDIQDLVARVGFEPTTRGL